MPQQLATDTSGYLIMCLRNQQFGALIGQLTALAQHPTDTALLQAEDLLLQRVIDQFFDDVEAGCEARKLLRWLFADGVGAARRRQHAPDLVAQLGAVAIWSGNVANVIGMFEEVIEKLPAEHQREIRASAIADLRMSLASADIDALEMCRFFQWYLFGTTACVPLTLSENLVASARETDMLLQSFSGLDATVTLAGIEQLQSQNIPRQHWKAILENHVSRKASEAGYLCLEDLLHLSQQQATKKQCCRL